MKNTHRHKNTHSYNFKSTQRNTQHHIQAHQSTAGRNISYCRKELTDKTIYYSGTNPYTQLSRLTFLVMQIVRSHTVYYCAITIDKKPLIRYRYHNALSKFSMSIKQGHHHTSTNLRPRMRKLLISVDNCCSIQ